MKIGFRRQAAPMPATACAALASLPASPSSPNLEDGGLPQEMAFKMIATHFA